MGQWPLMFINDESSVEIIFILTIVLVTNSKTTNFHTQQYEKKNQYIIIMFTNNFLANSFISNLYDVQEDNVRF